MKNGELRAAIEILTALPDDAAIDLVRRLAHLEQDSGESERAVLRLRKLAGRPGLEPADRLNIALDLVEALLAAGDAAGAAKELPQDADLATWLPEEIALRLQSLRTAIRQESAARPGGG